MGSTRIARRALKTPVALISFLDAERHWIKSRQGQIPETARDLSFCGHAILRAEPLIVRDALRDPRFSDNALVLSGPLLRFYAGIPVAAPDGSLVGTLCVMDTRPHDLVEADLALLKDLAGIVEHELCRPSASAASAG